MRDAGSYPEEDSGVEPVAEREHRELDDRGDYVEPTLAQPTDAAAREPKPGHSLT